MPQTLTVISEFLDRGKGLADVTAALVAATDTQLNFRNDGNLIMLISNADASPHTATLKATPDPYGRGGAGVNDEALVIAAGDVGLITFMNPAMFNAGGIVTVTLDAITSVSVGLYRLRKG